MATHEEANLYLASLAETIDMDLSENAPNMTFAIVFWVKGQESRGESIAIMNPPDVRAATIVALRTGADCIEGGLH